MEDTSTSGRSGSLDDDSNVFSPEASMYGQGGYWSICLPACGYVFCLPVGMFVTSLDCLFSLSFPVSQNDICVVHEAYYYNSINKMERG